MILVIDIINKIGSIIEWIMDFFVMMWKDDDFWWYLAGLVIVIIALCKILIFPLWRLFSSIGDGFGKSVSRRSVVSRKSKDMKVIINGVYQMNGPKPFVREIICPASEARYYSQLMTNKSKQAQWIRANFPVGAETERGFSMAVNIK